MAIIIDRLFFEPDTWIKFAPSKWRKYLTVKNLFIPILIILFLRIIGISTTFIILIAIVSFYYFSNKNVKKQKDKVEFLSDIMYNNEEEPYGVKSYLEFAPELVNFYYKNRDYIDYNLSSYRKSLENTNNLLKLEFDMNQVVKYPEQLFQNGLIQYRESLNNFHSIIYKLPSDTFSNYRLDDDLKELQKLLNRRLKNMTKIINNKNDYDLTIYSTPDPLQLMSDLNNKFYSPNYSFF